MKYEGNKGFIDNELKQLERTYQLFGTVIAKQDVIQKQNKIRL